MSCEECELVQSQVDTTNLGVYYFRIGNANVMVVCCENHAKELQSILRGEKPPEITEKMLEARWGKRETVYTEDDQE